ncbi:hypothetical protein MUK42_20030 [Musa troglodytarum]|uniref:Uncharacterized protein n=1 Tax=Musa troglodytarum TaxID=320322 RepID=A0A9E7JJA4_9LILI|nr:hypothetical protein MUK42_20030 [Musa troglodytarum]
MREDAAGCVSGGGYDSGSRGRQRWVAAQEEPAATVVAAVVATESSAVAGPNGCLRQQAAARSGFARSVRGASNGKAAPLVGGPTWCGPNLRRSSLDRLRKGLLPTEDACERGSAAQQRWESANSTQRRPDLGRSGNRGGFSCGGALCSNKQPASSGLQ